MVIKGAERLLKETQKKRVEEESAGNTQKTRIVRSGSRMNPEVKACWK